MATPDMKMMADPQDRLNNVLSAGDHDNPWYLMMLDAVPPGTKVPRAPREQFGQREGVTGIIQHRTQHNLEQSESPGNLTAMGLLAKSMV